MSYEHRNSLFSNVNAEIFAAKSQIVRGIVAYTATAYAAFVQSKAALHVQPEKF